MQNNTEQLIRRYDLDWLRSAAILVVFFYHSLHFFDTRDWSVKNSHTFSWINWLMDSIGVWIMPLIFLISGTSVFYAVRKTNALKFLRDKVMRLLLPLLVGIFSFSMMQVYLERISHGQFHGSFFEFIPHYFEGLYFPGGKGNFAFHGMHLWYLLFLFIFTLAFMPLFYWFKGKNGNRFLRRLGDVLSMPGAFLLILVPTIIIQNLASGFMQNGGWSIIQYPWFFLSGYLIASHQKLQSQIVKMRWTCAGVVLTIIILLLLMHKGADNHCDVLVWFELFTILGFAMKRLNFSKRFLPHCNEAVMPFYILHQNILLLLGYFIVGLELSDSVKFLIIVVSTLMMILLLYVFLIRKYNSLRILFGMKPTKKSDIAKTFSF